MSDDGFYRCPSGKRAFYSQRLANRAINKAISRGEMPPLRAYECDDCGHWHLATNTRRVSRVVALGQEQR